MVAEVVRRPSVRRLSGPRPEVMERGPCRLARAFFRSGGREEGEVDVFVAHVDAEEDAGVGAVVGGGVELLGVEAAAEAGLPGVAFVSDLEPGVLAGGEGEVEAEEAGELVVGVGVELGVGAHAHEGDDEDAGDAFDDGSGAGAVAAVGGEVFAAIEVDAVEESEAAPEATFDDALLDGDVALGGDGVHLLDDLGGVGLQVRDQVEALALQEHGARVPSVRESRHALVDADMSTPFEVPASISREVNVVRPRTSMRPRGLEI